MQVVKFINNQQNFNDNVFVRIPSYYIKKYILLNQTFNIPYSEFDEYNIFIDVFYETDDEDFFIMFIAWLSKHPEIIKEQHKIEYIASSEFWLEHDLLHAGIDVKNGKIQKITWREELKRLNLAYHTVPLTSVELEYVINLFNQEWKMNIDEKYITDITYAESLQDYFM